MARIERLRSVNSAQHHQKLTTHHRARFPSSFCKYWENLRSREKYCFQCKRKDECVWLRQLFLCWLFSNARIYNPGQTDRFHAFSVGGRFSSIYALPVSAIQISFHLLFSFFQVTKDPLPCEEVGMEVVGVLVPSLDRRHDYHLWKPCPCLPLVTRLLRTGQGKMN